MKIHADAPFRWRCRRVHIAGARRQGRPDPVCGPYFNYGFTPNATWHFSLNRLWLDVLPGVAVALGGLRLRLGDISDA
ncbi:MAG: hypothetical protein ACYDA6_04905 [Solirubrobacteraceae bacterium]